MEGLAKLKPAFSKDGSTTPGNYLVESLISNSLCANAMLYFINNERLTLGNSSQRSDGAAAVILAKRSTAERLGLPILGKMVAYAVIKIMAVLSRN